MFEEQLLQICGADEVLNIDIGEITHIISISNPGAKPVLPLSFHGEHLPLFFGDVISEADAVQCHTTPPTIDDVSQSIQFAKKAWSHPSQKLLVFCDYGASRSPAIAYAALSYAVGPGSESLALQHIVDIRGEALPNRMVVELGDHLLQRQGALLKPVLHLYKEISDQLDICLS